ncbi:MAG: 30S ribosomal protein S10 [Candidatus Diapherotrites archaeon]|nr:30S ribosomal protein S10 [Candidatus Diapherotrites archaeon]
MSKARIKIAGPEYAVLDKIANQIVMIAKNSGVKYTGPVPLPTRHLRVELRRSQCGGGTETYEHREMRIHKRLIDVDAEESTIRQIIRIPKPRNVEVILELKA